MVSGERMIGAIGPEPATACIPFDKRNFSRHPGFPNPIVFQHLSTHIDFTHFKENDKCRDRNGTIGAIKMNGNS
jgi:hypothetical protein